MLQYTSRILEMIPIDYHNIYKQTHIDARVIKIWTPINKLQARDTVRS